MNMRTLIVLAGLCVGVMPAGARGLDDKHGAHDDHAPTRETAPTKAAPRSETPPESAAPKPPTKEFGPGGAVIKKDPAKPNAITPITATTKSTVDAVDGPIPADQALQLLLEGNERWTNNSCADPATEISRRKAAAEGQKPFATILTCADSRLPVERLFDRGVGELFVLRVAGNVVSGNEAGTIEYGAGHLNVPLLVVMGHTKCGAVAAAASRAEGHEVPPNIAGLLAHIEPAIARARKSNPDAEDGALAAAAVRENVWQSIFDLIRSSGPVRAQLRAGKLTVVGAVCDVATGKVEWLGEHPWQEELVNAFDARAEARTGLTHAAPQHEDATANAPTEGR